MENIEGVAKKNNSNGVFKGMVTQELANLEEKQKLRESIYLAKIEQIHKEYKELKHEIKSIRTMLFGWLFILAGGQITVAGIFFSHFH